MTAIKALTKSISLKPTDSSLVAKILKQFQSASGSQLERSPIKDLFTQVSIPKPQNWIEPAKREFKTARGAVRYGKYRAVKALQGENPYEHLVIIDKKAKRVFGEYKGDSNSAKEDILEHMKRAQRDNVIAIHGHPTFCVVDGKPATTPISLPDAFFLNEKTQAIYAYNAKGEFSLLRKKPNFVPWTQEQISNFIKEYTVFMTEPAKQNFLQTMCQYAPELKGKTYDEIIELSKNPDFLKKIKSLIPKEIRQQMVQSLKKCNDYSDISVLRRIDAFWRKFADRMGLIYETNYSYLK